jgi:hypothetical protein
MPDLVLTQEQAEVLARALEPVRVCDPQGNVLRVIPPIWTQDDIAEAKRILASNHTWYTTEQVLAHRRSLEQK